jgi:hypothetical protein
MTGDVHADRDIGHRSDARLVARFGLVDRAGERNW